jgi:hypothetical protein
MCEVCGLRCAVSGRLEKYTYSDLRSSALWRRSQCCDVTNSAMTVACARDLETSLSFANVFVGRLLAICLTSL